MAGWARAAVKTEHGIRLQLDIAAALVLRSRLFFAAWFLSAGVECRAAHREFWDEFWTFWRFNEHALLFSYIIHMASLFETRRDTVNLPRLWRLQAENSRRHEIADRIETLFRQTAATAKGLTILRSSVMAHRSISLSYNEAFKKAQITPNAMRALTDDALLLVNLLRSIHDLGEERFDELALGDLKALASSPPAPPLS